MKYGFPVIFSTNPLSFITFSLKESHRRRHQSPGPAVQLKGVDFAGISVALDDIYCFKMVFHRVFHRV